MRKTFIAASIATALLLVGCSDSAASSGPAASASSGDGELTSVRVAALPITETAALYAGISAGIFEEHGLDVEVVPSQGGAQAIPAMLSGDVQFATGQPFGPFRAELQDLGIVMIGNYAPSFAEGPDTSGVVASAASGVKRPKDLEGKRVSVNSLGAAGDLTIKAAVDRDGGDSSKIEFIEVAFPDAAAQLDAGNIDAAWIPEPFNSSYVESGGTFVMHNFQLTIPGLTTLTTVTSEALIESDPETVDAFAAAMREALDWANDPANEDAVRASIVSDLQLPEAVANSILLPVWSFDLDRKQLEELVDLAVEYGTLDSAPDLDAIIDQR